MSIAVGVMEVGAGVEVVVVAVGGVGVVFF